MKNQFEELGINMTHGVYKRTEIPAGKSIEQHSHTFDHTSVLVQGMVYVSIDENKKVYYEAPAEILIPAGKVHTVEAITQVIWYCNHEMQNINQEMFDEMIPLNGKD